MDDAKAWKGLARVAAPEDFEDRVLRELDRRRRARPQERRVRLFKWALSGSAAALLAFFIILNFVVPGKEPRTAGGYAVSAAEPSAIPVMETIDYGREIRAGSTDAEAVYLQEQISDSSFAMIRY